MKTFLVNFAKSACVTTAMVLALFCANQALADDPTINQCVSHTVCNIACAVQSSGFCPTTTSGCSLTGGCAGCSCKQDALNDPCECRL